MEQELEEGLERLEKDDGDGVFQSGVVSQNSLRTRRGSVVSFHNIHYSVQLVSGLPCRRVTEERKILHNVEGIMKPGLNAILGPTGCGKSSLLDVLAARKDPRGLSGEVLIDGSPRPPNFKCISGYVVQDDVVMGTLTVRENLLFSAALRLPRSISFWEKKERVTQILSELGLTRVADCKVGTELIRGVSGGERKRTNIGMELITEPPVLFLDEPTTGLDSSTAHAVLLLLKRLSQKGRTIILAIHQPRYSIFKLFDSLTLLALGRVVYHGRAQEALDYFRTIGYECEPFNNPADFFLDVINGDSTAVAARQAEGDPPEKGAGGPSVGETLCKLYLASPQAQSLQLALSAAKTVQKGAQRAQEGWQAPSRAVTYANGSGTQLYWLAQRSFKNLVRNPQASIAQVAVTTVLALVLGAIFFRVKLDQSGIQNRVGAMFFVTTNQCFSSVSAIELFIKDKKLFVHQYTSGYYRVSAYFFALLFADLLPMRTVPAVVFSCISYWMIGFQASAGNFFFFMLTLMLVSYTATAMSLAISAGMEVVGVANLFITICFVFMIMLRREVPLQSGGGGLQLGHVGEHPGPRLHDPHFPQHHLRQAALHEEVHLAPPSSLSLFLPQPCSSGGLSEGRLSPPGAGLPLFMREGGRGAPLFFPGVVAGIIVSEPFRTTAWFIR
ncbi:broad substrate specificity ATP-binding cassette transporter ABCG2-like isoform X2 [Tachyglossus aculeatus]|uniref:broad substrate specificity ATP-binding cassette transporter ABCG2-like isoform X2 n=1 Tax=Tachyglossus aculeatus TaxID=9261 RepID=UPI0018F4CAC6|nr:broad substrate specificity ATP-binding cassette transporter ABCG2-like isoform X2 [Tachyglossus aculeatus]